MKALLSLSACLFIAFLPSKTQANSFLDIKMPSHASDVSLEPLINLTAVSANASHPKLTVKHLRMVGGSVEVLLVSAGTGVSATLSLSAELVRLSGLVVGSSVIVTAVVGGVLLMAGSEALAFIPDAVSRAHMHHRNLSQ